MAGVGRQPGRFDNDAFFDAPPPPVPRAPALVRLARRRTVLAATLFGIGTLAVFVDQAPFLIQVLLGAPIFEECWKFGLALLLSSWVPARRLAATILRLPIAWAVGAGFGVLEHYLSYSDEDPSTYAFRVLFHGGSTGLSMAMFNSLEPASDVRVRYFALVPSMVIHYANNGLAILQGIGSIAVGFAQTNLVGFALAALAVLLTPVVIGAGAAIRDRLQAWLGRRFPAPASQFG